MTLHRELLRQTWQLTRKERRREPVQADLRRAISTAYYALFHLLIADATRRLFTGMDREALRMVLARTFNHGTMKDAASSFANRSPKPAFFNALQGREIQQEIVHVAQTFSNLQQSRTEADYDVTIRYERIEAHQ